MTKLLVIIVLVQVDAGPAAKESQSAIDRAQAAVVLELLPGLFLRTAQHGAEQRQEFDALGVTAELGLGHLTDLGDVVLDDGRAVPGDEDGLCVLGGKGLAGLGCSRLEDERGPLGARLADVRAGDGEVFSLVVDLADPGGVSVDTALLVEDNGIVSPGRFPELVCDSDVFFCDRIAVVMLEVDVN